MQNCIYNLLVPTPRDPLSLSLKYLYCKVFDKFNKVLSLLVEVFKAIVVVSIITISCKVKTFNYIWPYDTFHAGNVTRT